ncbi:M20 family metallo-hydrolase [Desulfocurvus sp. DL9XJH121]
MPNSLLERLDAMAGDVIDLQWDLVAIPALGPENGGQGEKAKADYLLGRLLEMDVPEVRELKAPDERVDCGYRPNILARVPGQDTGRTLWIISHTDVVPPGDPRHWDSDPFELRVDGDILVGRGVEDNHAGLVPSLLLLTAVLEEGVTPPMNLGLLMVADEETGSGYGLGYVVREHGDLFGPRDLFVVPDFGVADSSMIEVAEKSILWLRLEVTGVQCHASTPEQGVNAMVAGSALALLLNRELPLRFPATDDLFSPPESTFTPTKREANVPNVNTMPGSDVFYLDCRVLPRYPLDEVEAVVRELASRVEAEYGVAVTFSPVQREEAAPPTPADSEVVRRLQAGIREVYGVEAGPAGMGGGTVAAFLRRAGHEAAVWSTIMHNAHQPNERALISTQVKDAKVLALMLMS